ncbi:MAG TPA: DUF5808 domain-containing protein [Polyangia bacterium]|nr:DUF5808 domain-containing protein [Polyangia bacterium]
MTSTTLQTISWLVPMAAMAVIAILGHVAPDLARRELFFAITVPAHFRDGEVGQRVLAGYRRRLWLHALLAMGLAALLLVLHRPGLLPLALGWQMCGFVLAFFHARNETVPHAVTPTTRREAALAPRPLTLPGGWVGVGLPFGILGATALYLKSRWDDLPASFPVHWGLEGADRFATRAPHTVYGSLFIGAVMCAVLIGLMVAIIRTARPVHVRGAAAAADAARRQLILQLLAATEYFLAVEVSLVALLPLLPEELQRQAVVVLGILPLGLALGVALMALRARDRLDVPVEAQGGVTVGDRMADSCWKGGIFYVNPDDPALFIEKRLGIGYTLNFGRPGAWVLIGVVILIPLVATVLGATG